MIYNLIINEQIVESIDVSCEEEASEYLRIKYPLPELQAEQAYVVEQES